MFDHYVVHQRWRPNFDPSTVNLERMVVWIRLPRLPLEYFRDDVIKMIIEHVDIPLKLDKSTASIERGKFARAAVEINLTKPLVSMIRIGHTG